MELDIRQADIYEVEAEAMVFPGSTNGDIFGPNGRRLLRRTGKELRKRTREIAPIAIGAATVVEATGLGTEYVIYAPVISEVGEKITVENVRRCTRAALVATVARDLESVAMQTIRPNSDDMSVAETARAMVDELRGFRADHDFRAIVVDPDARVVDILQRAYDIVR